MCERQHSLECLRRPFSSFSHGHEKWLILSQLLQKREERKKRERERERDHEGLLPNVSSEMKLGQRHCIFGTSAQGILKRFGREKVWGEWRDGYSVSCTLFLFAIFRRVHLSRREEERRGEERRGEEKCTTFFETVMMRCRLICSYRPPLPFPTAGLPSLPFLLASVLPLYETDCIRCAHLKHTVGSMERCYHGGQ